MASSIKSKLSSLLKKKKKKAPASSSKQNHTFNTSDQTKSLYFAAEFKVLGDTTKDGKLSLEEFYRLMMLLQFPGDREETKIIWKSQGKTEGGHLSEDEYINMMFDKNIQAKTNVWRQVFAEIDDNGTGWGSRNDVIKGLEKIGIEVNDSMRKKLDEMDADKDGRVTYGDFLKRQLKQ